MFTSPPPLLQQLYKMCLIYCLFIITDDSANTKTKRLSTNLGWVVNGGVIGGGGGGVRRPRAFVFVGYYYLHRPIRYCVTCANEKFLFCSLMNFYL